MKLFFIRHGQSFNNRLWDQTQNNMGRVADPELTDVGRQQAQLVAQFLKKKHQEDVDPESHDYFAFTHLYSSLQVRAMDTANAIAEALDMTPVIWEAIHETGGIWMPHAETGEPKGLPGKNRADFAARFPNFVLPDDLDQAGWWNRPFEDIEGYTARASEVVADLHERHGNTDDRVAIVSHGGFYNHLLMTLIQMPILKTPVSWFTMNNTAMSRFDFEDIVRIRYQNRVDFLPTELVT